ncbi:acyltransferase family protein [Novacetimonas pomaceti]|uniref:Acyltransferase n=1 Tax=Novacetimonas pomaceti TaxID=2021998 RepID=A0ABX5P4U4_9PROT|nr:acyltransferase [Novacetimonas pomaceti]PYD48456.1 acyltransferase [Novacetimonas pomaceti]
MGAPRHHYAALDGVRGFAALSVMIFHLGHWLDVPGLAVNSGLAVDLFFCLSGYVLSLSYGTRMMGQGSLSMGQFLFRRLVRLMPVIVVATVIGAAYVLSRGHLNGEVASYGVFLTAVLLSLLDIPYLSAPRVIGGPQVFPLNGPQYSLFLELFINLFWWATRRIDQRYLSLAIIVICLPLVGIYGLGGDVPATFLSGFPRVGASFFIGVALYRFAPSIPAVMTGRITFVASLSVMALLFFWPYAVSRGVELAWIAVFSPLLVISGARVRLSSGLSRISLLGGELSYPLYALHYPVFCWVNGLFQATMHARMAQIEAPLVLVMAIAISFGVLKGIDEPLRQVISSRYPGKIAAVRAPAPVVYPVGETSIAISARQER